MISSGIKSLYFLRLKGTFLMKSIIPRDLPACSATVWTAGFLRSTCKSFKMMRKRVVLLSSATVSNWRRSAHSGELISYLYHSMSTLFHIKFNTLALMSCKKRLFGNGLFLQVECKAIATGSLMG